MNDDNRPTAVRAGRPVRRRLLYGLVAGLTFIAVILAGSEWIASFAVPAWPARELRPVPAAELRDSLAATFGDSRELIPVYNGWGLRDRPRQFARPPGVRWRSVFVGDSFLEGYFVSRPLTERIEDLWAAAGIAGREAINFGVTATGPRQYHYRVRDLALRLEPDLVVLALYAGNDFITPGYPPTGLPPLVAERPIPSLLGTPMPRTAWLIVNRLGLAEIGRGNKGIPGEFARLNQWAHQPADERLRLFVDHVQAHYHPTVDKAVIAEILSRGDGRLWQAFAPRAQDREFAAGWLLNGLVDWETGSWPVPRDAAEADRTSTATVEETLSWVLATRDLVAAAGRRFRVVLIPVGGIDPDYAAFWQAWPRYASYNLAADARHRRLASELRARGVPLVDLREALAGQGGSYRLLDGHWTEAGTERVARRLVEALAGPE